MCFFPSVQHRDPVKMLQCQKEAKRPQGGLHLKTPNRLSNLILSDGSTLCVRSAGRRISARTSAGELLQEMASEDRDFLVSLPLIF